MNTSSARTDNSNHSTGYRIAYAIGTLFIHSIALLAILVTLMVIVPVHRELFEQLNSDLLPPAVLVVRWSMFTVSYWYAIIAAIALCDTGVVAMLSLNQISFRHLLPIWTYLLLTGALILVVFMNMAITVPLQ